MATEVIINLATSAGCAIVLGGAALTWRLPAPQKYAALEAVISGTVLLLGLLALPGPDDQRNWRLVTTAVTFAVGALILADIKWVHEPLAAGAGIIVVDRLRRWLEPVFAPDGWVTPYAPAILFAWAAALVAGTLLVAALRSSNPGERFAVAGIWGAVGLALAIASALDLLPSWIAVVVLTVLPLGVVLPPGRPRPWLA